MGQLLQGVKNVQFVNKEIMELKSKKKHTEKTLRKRLKIWKILNWYFISENYLRKNHNPSRFSKRKFKNLLNKQERQKNKIRL